MVACSDRHVAPDRAKSADRGSIAYVTVVHVAVLPHAHLGGNRYALQLYRRFETERREYRRDAIEPVLV